MPAYFDARFGNFEASAAREVIGRLVTGAARSGHSSLYVKQIDAWEETLSIIDRCKEGIVGRIAGACDWHLFLEFEIPRRQRRPDAILLARDVIFVIEFKIGAASFDTAGRFGRSCRDCESLRRVSNPVHAIAGRGEEMAARANGSGAPLRSCRQLGGAAPAILRARGLDRVSQGNRLRPVVPE